MPRLSTHVSARQRSCLPVPSSTGATGATAVALKAPWMDSNLAQHMYFPDALKRARSRVMGFHRSVPPSACEPGRSARRCRSRCREWRWSTSARSRNRSAWHCSRPIHGPIWVALVPDAACRAPASQLTKRALSRPRSRRLMRCLSICAICCKTAVRSGRRYRELYSSIGA